MEDRLLEMCFDPGRWTAALNKALDKDMPKHIVAALTKKEVRASLYEAVKNGKYAISPPHTAKIPKDNGEFRTVFVNEPLDRIFLGICNDVLMETTGKQMIHPTCQSYQKGIGCGKIVKEVSLKMCQTAGDIVGWKADFSKYFDSVDYKYISEAFDRAAGITGKSVIYDVLTEYYLNDLYFDENGEVQSKDQSLKQGCAVASWLANVVMYELDERLSKLNGVYVRYSDDTLFVGEDREKAMEIMKEVCESKGITLNPNKVEWLSHDHWFKFLGFSIKGSMISLSKTRLKTFQKEIMKATVKDLKVSPEKALNRVIRYLYKGYGPESYSWAQQCLSAINSAKDILELDKFVMDCLRAVKTNKRRVGGLGYDIDGKFGCIQRGTGRNVTANRQKVPGDIEGYLTLGCMKKAMVTSVDLYNTLVMQL